MIRLRPLQTLPERALEGWSALARASELSNVFADPRWVVASACLQDVDPLVAWLGSDETPELVLPLSAAPRTRAMPVPHLRAFWTDNTYQASLLCRGIPCEEHLRALSRALGAAGGRKAAAISMAAQPIDAQSNSLDEAWGSPIVSRAWSRAAIDLTLDIADPLEGVSKNKRKKVRRSLSRLERLGSVSFDIVLGEAGADCFLRLEHEGWKGQNGTSLRALGRREVWFRSVVRAFGDDAVFTVLRCGDEVVATSVNFVSGYTAFGFKIGWNPAYAECSPGVLQELFYVRQAKQIFPGVRLVDSVSDEQSFVEPWWPDRRAFRSATYALTPTARAAHRISRGLQRLIVRGNAA
ncbi:MAG: CelD/BcsL family acetyltransferase involved in cellulose biosynthesis [Bradymonadia bacterium]